ncbi:MAG: CNNM domain-containing protein, partial [Candidatus Muiribacteriaceae bacterium]
MEDGDYLSLFFVVLLLLLSGFFSGSETAFFSIDKFKFNQLKKRKKYKGLLYLLERPRRLLITILLGNLFVNILVTVLATSYFVLKYGDLKGSMIASVVMTGALLIFGEITPKILAVNIADRFARFSTPFIRVFMFLFTPLNNLLLFIVNKLLVIIGLSEYTSNRIISQE